MELMNTFALRLIACERGKSDSLSKTLGNCLVLQSHSLPTSRTQRRGFLCPARSAKPAMTLRMLSSRRLWWSDIDCPRYLSGAILGTFWMVSGSLLKCISFR